MTAGTSPAPPAHYASGATALFGCLLLLPWLAGALTLAVAWSGLPRVACGCLLALLAFSGLLSWRFWCGQKPRLLIWDGGNWLLTRPGVAPDARRHAVDVAVALDLQFALLVRCRAVGQPGRTRWLWLQRAADDPRWHALRCAVFAAPPGA